MAGESRWTEPSWVNPEDLTPEQLRKVEAKNIALRKYYRTGDPTDTIRVGALSKDFKALKERADGCQRQQQVVRPVPGGSG